MPVLLRGMTESERASILSPRTVRRVWRAVSETPQASYRVLATRLRLPKSTVHYALLRLKDAGYVTWETGQRRARRIIVPFVAITRKNTWMH